jgi:eukaryotic-like serine/threonine-protein kinase
MFLEAGKERPFLASRFNEVYAEFSPDGKWIAFTSNESGRNEVYVTPYPGPGPRVLVSAGGGHSSAWTRSGRELIYLSPLGPNDAAPYAVTAVSFEPGSPPTIGSPQKLFETPMGLSASVRGYDVARDGSRLLMVQPQPREPLKPSEIVLVQNWFGELVRRAPAN